MCVGVGVKVGVLVGVGVEVGVLVGVGVEVRMLVAVGVGVDVFARLGWEVAVRVGVRVGTLVEVRVEVMGGVGDWVARIVSVGCIQSAAVGDRVGVTPARGDCPELSDPGVAVGIGAFNAAVTAASLIPISSSSFGFSSRMISPMMFRLMAGTGY